MIRSHLPSPAAGGMEGGRVPAPAEGPDHKARAIVHLDLDAFFAAVEVLEDPELEGKPVLVGGSPEGRGVVTSASYPARHFGVHSAMPMARALALCPQAIVLPARHRLYSAYSRRVMELLREATPLMEQRSIDEACLDLTDQIGNWGEVVGFAKELQQRVREQVGLSASLGVATNKLVAKVACERDKPGGLTVVHPGDEAAFLAPLPVRAMPGIGPVTEKKLLAMGVTTLGQLAQTAPDELRRRFGQFGPAMARHASGISHSPVVTEHEVKSVSRELTFSRDLTDAADLDGHLMELSRGVERRLKRAGLVAGTVSIKLRYSDFSTYGRQMTLAVPTDDALILHVAALTLFQRIWQPGRPVRLLGVGAHNLSAPVGQLRLW